MLLVTGGTGNIGREVMKQLGSAGAATRALVGRKGEAAAIEGPNVEIVEGDLGKPGEHYRAAFDGVDAAFLLSSGDSSLVGLQTTFAEAAKEAGLPRIVKLSVSGANVNSPVPFGKWHAQIEQAIRETGIPFTFLRPNYFMNNFLSLDRASITKENTIFAPMKDAAMSMVDVRDIAAVAARTLIDTGHEGQTYEITGPTAVSFAEAAETFTDVLGRPIIYVAITPEEGKERMLANGTPEWLADAMTILYGPLSAGYAADVADTTKTVGKKEPITFEQFARDYATWFSA